ncbi:MAG: hypothetical protein JWM99_1370 [Verrucomicrobiales bacterium]|nr:hypothetical protein [Verrucomicrobiales bacterium]
MLNHQSPNKNCAPGEGAQSLWTGSDSTAAKAAAAGADGVYYLFVLTEFVEAGGLDVSASLLHPTKNPANERTIKIFFIFNKPYFLKTKCTNRLKMLRKFRKPQ